MDLFKDINGSEERYLLGQDTTCVLKPDPNIKGSKEHSLVAQFKRTLFGSTIQKNAVL